MSFTSATASNNTVTIKIGYQPLNFNAHTRTLSNQLIHDVSRPKIVYFLFFYKISSFFKNWTNHAIQSFVQFFLFKNSCTNVYSSSNKFVFWQIYNSPENCVGFFASKYMWNFTLNHQTWHRFSFYKLNFCFDWTMCP